MNSATHPVRRELSSRAANSVGAFPVLRRLPTALVLAEVRPTDNLQLAVLESGFRASGGLVTGDRLAAILAPHMAQPISRIARWIIHREIVNFKAYHQIWIPLFQFDEAHMAVRASILKVVIELRGVFDDLELAQWFVSPNPWLHEELPADLVRSAPHEVLQAARADRFVAAG